MLAQIVLTFTFLAALGAGLMAGLYFAFSNSVMGALARLPTAQGIAAMTSIDVVIMNPLFLSVFTGTAALALFLAIAALLGLGVPRPGFVLAGAALYILGNIVVTSVFNVPMNNALAAVAPDSAAGAQLWSVYLDRWVFWNHVRTVSCLAALAAFIAALM
jgi:uncharacterized membrane protein